MKDNFFLLEKEIRRIDQKLVIQFKDFISKLLQTYNTNEVKIVVEELYVLNLMYGFFSHIHPYQQDLK